MKINFFMRLFGRSEPHNLERQHAKFRNQYPHYKFGGGTYGIPAVYDFDDGTGLSIARYCAIVVGVQIFLGGNHRMDWVKSYPFPAFFAADSNISQFTQRRGNVEIGSDDWFDANYTILSGVTVGYGAVIASSAVVTRNVEPYAIMAGNPAKNVRWCFDGVARKALLASAGWEWLVSELEQIMSLMCSDNIAVFNAYAQSRQSV